MDPDAFTSTLFKWDPRSLLPTAAAPPPMSRPPLLDYTVAPPPVAHPAAAATPREQELGGVEELFQAYGVRYYTAAKVAELGFTARTLVNMKEEELEEMMNSLSHIFRWDLLVGERYGIIAAVRAERRRRRRNLDSTTNAPPIDNALSQEGVAEERVVVVQQKKEAVGSTLDSMRRRNNKEQQMTIRQRGIRRTRMRMRMTTHHHENEEQEDDDDDDEDAEEGMMNNTSSIMNGGERQREHPFIVTEAGEVARGKKNGLDHLFELYEQCGELLGEVQRMAKERGHKCPTKVTNEVFRYAKEAGATHINKPKMRHYVHCYALHCLHRPLSDHLRAAFKDSGHNVGAWRAACYKPLVAIAALHDWDIDAVFNAHPRLSIWYVPTKLRQLCHAHRNSNAAAAAAASTSLPLPTTPHLPPF